MSLAQAAREYDVIDGLVKRAHHIARSKGWWDEIADADTVTGTPAVPPTIQAVKLALIHSEVSEALECVRDGDLALRFDEKGKPEGLPSELADIVIRVADLCGALGIDLAVAIAKKLTFNETRTHRHGGRLL